MAALSLKNHLIKKHRLGIFASNEFVKTLQRTAPAYFHLDYSRMNRRMGCVTKFGTVNCSYLTNEGRKFTGGCIKNQCSPIVGTSPRAGNSVRFNSGFTQSSRKLDSTSVARKVVNLYPRIRRELQHSVGQQANAEMFGDHRVAYGEKSTFELLRVLSFFFLCRFAFITDNSVRIMSLCYRVFGRTLAERLIRSAVYDQFVAGEGPREVKRVAARLRQVGVASILCVPMETDDTVDDKLKVSRDRFLDANLEKVVSSIDLCADLGDAFPMTQFRISALLAGDLTKTVSKFCEKRTHDHQVLAALTRAMFGSQVDFSQLPGWTGFPRDRNGELGAGLRRLGKVAEALVGRDVIVLIDGELTQINPALRLLSLCLMKICNVERAKVFHTYQTYLKVTRSHLENDLIFASANNLCFGVKLVRGAYLVTERQLARELGYEDPVNETFEVTSTNYHHCLDLLLGHVKERPTGAVRLIVASHNEETMRYAMYRMAELGLPKDGPSVFFGQLYGMADHVSCTLGRHGYRVYKSIPFGPIMETLPYLARRAQENKAILANARRERKLVTKALVDRIILRSR